METKTWLSNIKVDQDAGFELRALKLELSRKAAHTVMMSDVIRVLLATYREVHANDLDVVANLAAAIARRAPVETR